MDITALLLNWFLSNLKLSKFVLVKNKHCTFQWALKCPKELRKKLLQSRTKGWTTAKINFYMSSLDISWRLLVSKSVTGVWPKRMAKHQIHNLCNQKESDRNTFSQCYTKLLILSYKANDFPVLRFFNVKQNNRDNDIHGLFLTRRLWQN